MKAKVCLSFSLSEEAQTCRPWGVRNLYGDFDFSHPLPSPPVVPPQSKAKVRKAKRPCAIRSKVSQPANVSDRLASNVAARMVGGSHLASVTAVAILWSRQWYSMSGIRQPTICTYPAERTGQVWCWPGFRSKAISSGG